MIDGTYVVKQLMGQGGMGSVYLAEHHILRKEYAVKVLAPDQVTEENWHRFSLEGRAIARLDHPAIVKVHNMGIDDQTAPFYVMDLLRGQPLSNYCRPNSRLNLAQILHIFAQVAAGLNYAHKKGIIHRDIKPSNIMIEDNNGDLEARIVDFGIAKLAYESSLNRIVQAQTKAGEIFGSPLYMSPEQSLGETCDFRSDIYSLGCTMFEVLTQSPPFKGETAIATLTMHQSAPVPHLYERAPDLEYPDSLDYLIGKMLEKDRSKRYQSMNHVIHDLERITSGKSIGKDATQADLSDREPSNFSWTNPGSRFGYYIAGSVLIIAAIVGGATYLSMDKLYSQDKKAKQEAAVFKKISPGMSEVTPAESSLPNLEEDAIKSLKASDPKETARLLACGPIKSTYITRGGKKLRAIQFPPVSIGVLMDQAKIGLRTVTARGPVVVEAGDKLRLDVMTESCPVAVFHPEIYKRVGYDEFDALRLRPLTGNHQFWRTDEEAEAELPCFVKIMEIASHWTKLQELQLDGVTVETAEQVASLDGFKNVYRLIVSKAGKFPTSAAAGKNLFRHISYLYFDSSGSANPLLAEMSKYDCLSDVFLDGAHVDAQTIEHLSHCKKLWKFTIMKGNIDDKTIAAMAHLKGLNTLEIYSMALSAEQVKAIEKALPSGSIHFRKEDFSSKNIALLQSKRVVFHDSE